MVERKDVADDVGRSRGLGERERVGGVDAESDVAINALPHDARDRGALGGQGLFALEHLRDRVLGGQADEALAKGLAARAIQERTQLADEWVAESEAGRANFHALEAKGKEHPIEQVGGKLRAMMPWIGQGKTSVQDASGGQG